LSSDFVERVQRVFSAARAVEPTARAGFLDSACAGDSALRREVESLLRSSADPGADILNTPALGQGFRVVSDLPDVPHLSAHQPKTIGRYRIIRRIGAGGMGIVYEAEQEKTGSTVALKVIRPGLASSELLRRFEHEAQVLGRLRHPGIARVYEAGIHHGDEGAVPYIVMELIEGPSLLAYVRHASLELPAILRVFVLICDAVHHAHQKGVIHRDLKPGNVLVEGAGDSVQTKILDFGIARVSDADTLLTTLQTQAGQLIGTLKYMSPEQAAGDPTDIDTRSDVYALGVILYELLTRRLPYDVDQKLIHEAIRAIREDEARPLSSISRVYRGDLTTILSKALEKDKSRRYQSASDLAADIRRYLSDEPITAHPPSAMYQLRKFARRNRGLVASAVVVFVLLLSGIISTSWQARVASLARDDAQGARMAEKEQRERAERRLREVHSVTRDLIFDFDNQIKRLAGSTPAREFLVTRALEYLSSVAEDLDPDDMQLKAELGAAYFQLGDVQGDPRIPNLGDAEGALQSYLAGVPFVEDVAAAVPDHIGNQISLASAYNRIGQLLASMGRRDEADAYFDRAREHLEKQRLAHPESGMVLREVGHCYGIEVDALQREGRLEPALEKALKVLPLLRAAVEYEPSSTLSRHALASMNSQIAEILDGLGRDAESIGHRETCLAIMEALVEDEPHNSLFLSDVCKAAERLGFALQQTGQFESALPYCRRAVEVSEALVAADPTDEGYQRGLIVGYIRLGEAQLGLGQNDMAAESFRRHLELCEAFAEPRPDDAEARRMLAVAYYKLADVERAQAKVESVDDRQRRVHRQAARAWLEKCHAVFIEMRARGILATSDGGVPAMIAGEIDACDAGPAE